MAGCRVGAAEPIGCSIGVLLVSGPEPMGPYRGRSAILARGGISNRVRSAQGQDTRLPELAADLVRSRVDVIIAVLTQTAHAAKNTRHSHRRDGRRSNRDGVN